MVAVVGEVLHLPLEVVGGFNEEEISMVFIISARVSVIGSSQQVKGFSLINVILSSITIIQCIDVQLDHKYF